MYTAPEAVRLTVFCTRLINNSQKRIAKHRTVNSPSDFTAWRDFRLCFSSSNFDVNSINVLFDYVFWVLLHSVSVAVNTSAHSVYSAFLFCVFLFLSPIQFNFSICCDRKSNRSTIFTSFMIHNRTQSFIELPSAERENSRRDGEWERNKTFNLMTFYLADLLDEPVPL